MIQESMIFHIVDNDMNYAKACWAIIYDILPLTDYAIVIFKI